MRRRTASAAALPRLDFHLESGMRVGLYGGSFNPAHPGHAHVARAALARLRLDRVIWLVSPQNPLKAPEDSNAYAHRLGGARAQARGPRMVVSDAEARLGVRYSLDTVRALKARFPRVKFVWIMGADSLASLHLWRGWTRLLRLIPIAVVARPGSSLASRTSPAAHRFAFARRTDGSARRLADLSPPAWAYLDAPWHKASSTALRDCA